MKPVALLVLSVVTGHVVSSRVKGCQGGWLEFICRYPSPQARYDRIDLQLPNHPKISSSQKDVWEPKGSLWLYHNTSAGALRVALRQLQPDASGEYECKFHPRSKRTEENEREVEVEVANCLRTFEQTAYRSAPTTITCSHPEGRKFFCKDRESICEEIELNGTHTNTHPNLQLSISDVSSSDAGVYWCGLESGLSRASITRTQLQVEDVTTVTESPAAGQTLTYWLSYPEGLPIKKFLCKGADPSSCQPLVSTAQTKQSSRFTISDRKEQRNLTVTLRQVAPDDSGTYWCGAQSTDARRSDRFLLRLQLMVEPPAPTGPSGMYSEPPAPTGPSGMYSEPPAPTGPSGMYSEPPAPTGPSESDGDSWSALIVVAIVCVPVTVIVFVLAYKRYRNSKNAQIGTAEEIEEDGAYEKIQERPPEFDARATLQTIYVTAGPPTVKVTLQPVSGEVRGQTSLTTGPNQQPTPLNVSHPARPLEDPVYSTISEPQNP
ncbi:CMRF35-like molecule 1 isoform X2 [Antennarius striatus]|uniref:CMRF35-like molecule 1 isoform X2 n=1 Tax=Antennarius striatus TaxID=241820 RepID=UPI0035ADEBB5